MAEGETGFVVSTTLATASALEIRPPSVETWLIQTVEADGAVELNRRDASAVIAEVDNLTAEGALTNMTYRANNTYYYEVENTSGATRKVVVTYVEMK